MSDQRSPNSDDLRRMYGSEIVDAVLAGDEFALGSLCAKVVRDANNALRDENKAYIDGLNAIRDILARPAIAAIEKVPAPDEDEEWASAVEEFPELKHV